jgi:hypothetical protein
MSKKSEEKKEAVNASEFAIGLFYDETKQHWNFVKVSYDPVTKAAGSVQVMDVGPSKDEATQEFKIFAGKFFL